MAVSTRRAPIQRSVRGGSVVRKRSKWPARRRSFTSVAVVLIGWELLARFIVSSDLFLPPFSSVMQAMWDLARSGVLWTHIYISGTEFLLGFALAATVGISVGTWMALSEPVRGYVEPIATGLYSTPIIALGPIFILWFGLGITSKVLVVFAVSVFPILINTTVGLRTTDKQLLEAVRSFGATRWQLFTKVQLPSSVPFIITGVRLGVIKGILGIVVAEFFGASAGLGFLIFNSAQTFNTANLFVGVIVLAVGGIASGALLKGLEEKIAPWRVRLESGL